MNGMGEAQPASGPNRAPSTARAAPAEVDFADTVQPGEATALALYAPTNAANEAARPDSALNRPDAFGLRRLLEGSAPGHRAGSSVIALRLAIGVVSLVVLLTLVLGRNLDLDTLRASVEQQVQGALVGSDLRSAALSPGVLSSAGAVDRQVQRRAPDAQPPQADTRDRLRDTASDVAIALGLGEPAAPAAPAVSPATPQMAAGPAPEMSVSEPKQEGCSEALAALAMCPKP
ncbi:hypothetical protein QTI24_26750 [Variovorax sp. J22P240]|uniref:hypothetical protein n=1 Tax=Variovorax sp. J22P240 TaxID=3053514 RepID=UPI002578FD2A|nr:hypothetical protein [Variovorax sp. J22P240]MDM0002230.1 hypothetical protein [Variovorax sp. J22P240]